MYFPQAHSEVRQRHGTRELREQRLELPQGAKANERNPRLRIREEVIDTRAGSSPALTTLHC